MQQKNLHQQLQNNRITYLIDVRGCREVTLSFFAMSKLKSRPIERSKELCALDAFFTPKNADTHLLKALMRTDEDRCCLRCVKVDSEYNGYFNINRSIAHKYYSCVSLPALIVGYRCLLTMFYCPLKLL